MYTFEELTNIIAKLRSPGGCPWDREQTHDSLKKHMIEEAYESLEALDSGNGAKMADEMGDLLLQIMLHAEIGKENGEYDINDVITALCEKMIRRHPHVFGDVQVSNSDEVLSNWDKIKTGERGETSVRESIKSISSYLPALMRAQKVQKKAAKAGFDWDDISGAFDKVAEETAEIKNAIDKKEDVEDEVGDLIFSAVNVSRMAGVDAEQALSRAVKKFSERFALVEIRAEEQGRKISDMTLSEMDKLWEEVKRSNK